MVVSDTVICEWFMSISVPTKGIDGYCHIGTVTADSINMWTQSNDDERMNLMGQENLRGNPGS